MEHGTQNELAERLMGKLYAAHSAVRYNFFIELAVQIPGAVSQNCSELSNPEVSYEFKKTFLRDMYEVHGDMGSVLYAVFREDVLGAYGREAMEILRPFAERYERGMSELRAGVAEARREGMNTRRLETALRLTEEVFGNLAEDVEKWLETFADSGDGPVH